MKLALLGLVGVVLVLLPASASAVHLKGVWMPTISTTLSSSKVVVGSSVHDSSALSGATADARGRVTYTVYSNNTCSAGAQDAGTRDVTNGVVPDSNSLTFTSAGDYYWQAVYSGDGDNQVATSPCTSEHLVVDKKSPSIGTTLSSSEVVVGSSVHDSSALSGATSTAGGRVTYTVYSNNTCSAGAQDAGTRTVTNGVVPDSSSLTFASAGDYYWQAVYSGDGNNQVATSTCTSEHLVVDRPAISITKTPGTQAVGSGGTASFTITVTNTGTVTLTSVTVTDSLSTGCAKLIGTLAPGQNTSYTCTQSGVAAAFTNVATATGHPPVGSDVTATGSADVTVTTSVAPPVTTTSSPSVVTSPSIAISKSPKEQSVVSGSAVTFTIVVTNSGDLTLSNVRVADPLAPACNRTSADIAGLASMAPSSSITYQCTLNNVTAGFTNVATDTGTPPSGSDVTATDTAHVTVTTTPFTPPKTVVVVSHPKIAIVKDPKMQTIAQGAAASFKITVTNTGDVALSNVTVTDPRSTDCLRSFGNLAAGASRSYSCSRTDVNAGFRNIATVTGTAPTGTKVTASDHATVKVAPFKPAKVIAAKVAKKHVVKKHVVKKQVVKKVHHKATPKPKAKPVVVSHVAPKTTG